MDVDKTEIVVTINKKKYKEGMCIYGRSTIIAEADEYLIKEIKTDPTIEIICVTKSQALQENAVEHIITEIVSEKVMLQDKKKIAEDNIENATNQSAFYSSLIVKYKNELKKIKQRLKKS